MGSNHASAVPARLRPPRLRRAVPRERLFVWLDAQRTAGSVWLSGPPGAGKTTLAASYLQARALKSLWYRLDADDTDLGRFFAVLGQGVDRLGVRARRPAFGAEHLVRPGDYARAWFRSVFAALPRPLAVVFDNVEQAGLPTLPVVLAAAIDEAGDGVSVLVTCRHAPPPELSAAALDGALAVLPEAALAFDAAEAALYADLFGLDATCVARAAARVGGWAAGLRLLSHAADSEVADTRPQALFDYFAGLLHDSLSPQGQHLLLVGALLPSVPAGLVARLAQVPDAVAQLDRLCAQHLFIERVARSAGDYRLHPLFREFLRQRGEQVLEPAARRALQVAAAQGLEAAGETDAAIDVLLDAAETNAAVMLMLRVLEDKLALGQLDQWTAWVQRLPPATSDREPALRYGLARIAFLREDAAALGHYEAACAGFAARGDLLGQHLCAAGVLEWSYNTDSFIGHARWSELLRRPLPAGVVPACEPHALRLLNGRLLARFFGGDFEPEAARWTDRVLERLVPGAAENDKLSVAITLLGCLERHKRWGDAQLLAGRMEALLASPRLGPRIAVLVRQQIAADLHRQCGDYAEARRLASLARAQARDNGFSVLEYEAVAILLLAALYLGDMAESRRLLDDLAALTDPGNVYHQRFAQQMRAWHEWQCGRPARAREHAEALRDAIARSDMPAPFRATWLLVAVLVRFAAGEEDAACAELAASRSAAEGGSRTTLDINLQSLEAWRDWCAGRFDAAAQRLADAWSLAAPIRYYQLLGPLRAPLAQLAAFALERGIAAPYVDELIARRRLRPPSPATLHWRWPLRIRTFGHFVLCVDREPMVFAGKVPKKPLALLKALVALGPRPVPESALADALWPDDAADAAHDALNVALHRLRRLIPGGAELIRLHEGRLSLDEAAVWTDCRAFEQLVAEADAAASQAPIELLQRALALYAGHFLAADADAPWSVSARERLRSKFNRVVTACAGGLAAAGREEEALACYKRGIETDDLDEQFYQGVMRCAIALGRPAEGLAAYQRLQRMLSLTLGVAPSARTEALRRELRGL